MIVRTRFAPSPTGMLHVGGARTALFNYLYARRHEGTFLLRIEDTDRERSNAEFIQSILDGLSWLGLDHDGEIVFQSNRAARHAEVAYQLLANGHAYYCYCTPDELREMRKMAFAEGRSPRYDRRCRNARFTHPRMEMGVAPAIRLKASLTGNTVLNDLVQGPVRIANSEMDDLILLRGDGSPTYLLAVVVDDHDMAITHVIRGDDHLTNTFRQIQIYSALGWELPEFAHIPLIHGPDGAKLSKRHGAVSLLDFRDAGFLPEALCNYLLRLGWSHRDLEVITRNDAIRLFDTLEINRASARMDYKKLLHLNGIYLRQADDCYLTTEVMRYLARRPNLALGPHIRERIHFLMPQLKQRAKTLVDLADSAVFLAISTPLSIEPNAAAVLTTQMRTLLFGLVASLTSTDFSVVTLNAVLHDFAKRSGQTFRDIAQPLRIALTGSTTSPEIDLVLAALGREESLARIKAICP